MKFEIKSLLVAVLLSITAFSCKVQFVPEYSSELESQIVKGAKLNDKLYLEMLNVGSPNRSFANFSDRYVEIEAELNSIRLKNEGRRKNVMMLSIIDNLITEFKKLRDEHKNAVLTDGQILVDQSTIKGFWKPLLVAEGGLKKAKNN